jgi:hypothetical protein
MRRHFRTIAVIGALLCAIIPAGGALAQKPERARLASRTRVRAAESSGLAHGRTEASAATSLCLLNRRRRAAA